MATISPCAVGFFSCLPRIAAFSHDFTVTHDHAAEGIVAARGFRDGHPHEALVVRLHRCAIPRACAGDGTSSAARRSATPKLQPRPRSKSCGSHLRLAMRCDRHRCSQRPCNISLSSDRCPKLPHADNVILMAGGGLSARPRRRALPSSAELRRGTQQFCNRHDLPGHVGAHVLAWPHTFDLARRA